MISLQLQGYALLTYLCRLIHSDVGNFRLWHKADTVLYPLLAFFASCPQTPTSLITCVTRLLLRSLKRGDHPVDMLLHRSPCRLAVAFLQRGEDLKMLGLRRQRHIAWRIVRL